MAAMEDDLKQEEATTKLQDAIEKVCEEGCTPGGGSQEDMIPLCCRYAPPLPSYSVLGQHNSFVSNRCAVSLKLAWELARPSRRKVLVLALPVWQEAMKRPFTPHITISKAKL